MALNAEETEKVNDYIQEHENDSITGTLLHIKESIAGNESEDENEFHLSNRLKNDEHLLAYAQLSTKENLSFSEQTKKTLLDLKLSITCSYFADFKDFIKELKKGENINENETLNGNTNSDYTTSDETQIENLTANSFCGLTLNEIKSEPYHKNPTTGTTRCSYTARLNGEHFGLRLPNGDAYNAGTKPGEQCLITIPSNKENNKPNNKRKSLLISEFASISEGNYADIYVESKSNYGHRATAFKADNGQRYVLDPYTRVKGVLNNDPKRLEDYIQEKKIVKAHIYESEGYTQSA